MSSEIELFVLCAKVRLSAMRLTAFDKIILSEILRGFAEYNTSHTRDIFRSANTKDRLSYFRASWQFC